jgi:hypothetical protein
MMTGMTKITKPVIKVYQSFVLHKNGSIEIGVNLRKIMTSRVKAFMLFRISALVGEEGFNAAIDFTDILVAISEFNRVSVNF